MKESEILSMSRHSIYTNYVFEQKQSNLAGDLCIFTYNNINN